MISAVVTTVGEAFVPVDILISLGTLDVPIDPDDRTVMFADCVFRLVPSAP